MKIARTFLLLFCLLPLTACDSDSESEPPLGELDLRIATAEKITIDGIGEAFSVNTPNALTVYKFNENVETHKDSVWTVSFDVAGTRDIPNKMVELEEGDNPLFYVRVTSKNNESKTHVVKIHRNYMAKVTFAAQSGRTQYVSKDDYGHVFRYETNNTMYTMAEEHEIIYPLPVMKYPGYSHDGYTFKKENNDTGSITIDKPYEVSQSITLSAYYSKMNYNIKLDADGGYVFHDNYSGDFFTEFSFPRADKPGYIFDGWYEGEYKVPKNKPLGYMDKFDDLTKSHTFKAKYIKGTSSSSSQYDYDRYSLFFGEYPQSLVKDEALHNELAKIQTINAKGYIEYNGEQYKRFDNPEYAIGNWPSGTFAYYDDNGQEVSLGTHFYKVEPVKWYRGESGKYLMDQIIDYVDYEDTFFDTAPYLGTKTTIKERYAEMENAIFSDEEKAKLVSKEIDLGKDSSNVSVKENMKMLPMAQSYLPSHEFAEFTTKNPYTEDFREEKYYFDKTWLSRTTEYARARGISYISRDYTTSSYPLYWVRSSVPLRYTSPYYLLDGGRLYIVNVFGEKCYCGSGTISGSKNSYRSSSLYEGGLDTPIGFRCAIEFEDE